MIAKGKKYWGVIPLAVYLILQFLVMVTEQVTDSQLRSIPQIILFWMGIFSGLIFLFWAGRIFLTWDRVRRLRIYGLFRTFFIAVFTILGFVSVMIGMFVSMFAYKPEHVVEKNGRRMVASVNSFQQELVYYYEYKNILFCGDKLLGWEDYGNGGNDPLEYDQEPIRREFYEEFSHGTPPAIVKVGTRDEEGASSGRDYDWI